SGQGIVWGGRGSRQRCKGTRAGRESVRRADLDLSEVSRGSRQVDTRGHLFAVRVERLLHALDHSDRGLVRRVVEFDLVDEGAVLLALDAADVGNGDARALREVVPEIAIQSKLVGLTRNRRRVGAG